MRRSNEAEAQVWQRQYPADGLEVRPRESKRCLNYCPFGKQLLCPYVAEEGRSRLQGSDRKNEVNGLHGL